MGQLPFDKVAQLTEQGGDEVLAEVPVAVWRLPSERVTSAGKTYSYTGQADVDAAAELVDHPNRHLIVDGRDLVIVGAAEHDFLPHVELQLRLTLQGG